MTTEHSRRGHVWESEAISDARLGGPWALGVSRPRAVGLGCCIFGPVYFAWLGRRRWGLAAVQLQLPVWRALSLCALYKSERLRSRRTATLGLRNPSSHPLPPPVLRRRIEIRESAVHASRLFSPCMSSDWLLSLVSNSIAQRFCVDFYCAVLFRWLI
jgi:hypothetical protein